MPTAEQLREALEPVRHWYESDDHDPRDDLDILRDVVADLQADRAEVLSLTRLSRLEAGGGGEQRELLRQAMNALGCADKPDPFEKLIGSDLTVWEAMRLESERLWAAYRALSAQPRTEDGNIVAELKRRIGIEGSQKAAAEVLGISEQYLSDILHGRREVSANVARAMGFERIVSFQPLSPSVED